MIFDIIIIMCLTDHPEGGWSPDKKKSNPEDDEPDPEKRKILEKIRQAAEESDDRLTNYFIAILAAVIAVFAYYAFVHGGANKPANAL